MVRTVVVAALESAHCRPHSRPGKARRGRMGEWSACLLLIALALAAANLPSGAAPISWQDDDWSGGAYAQTSGVDPEIHPGLLVLENRLDDIRFLADPTGFQGLYSMAVLHDSLFITASDYPFEYDGAEVVMYDYITNASSVVYEPYESGLPIIKNIADSLYLPGPDSMDAWYMDGSIYAYDGDEWEERAALPEAVHVCDVDIVNGVMYASTGQRDLRGAIWRSTDYGGTFARVLDLVPTSEHPIRRFFGLGHYGDLLFAQPDGFPPENNRLYTTTDGTHWSTVNIGWVPPDCQATFTAYGDSLLMTIHNRLYIYDGQTWLPSYPLPFEQWRWGRGIQEIKGEIYGGGQDCRIWHWLGGANWEEIGSLGLDPSSETIESMAVMYGRLYVSTSRYTPDLQAHLYAAAAVPTGQLVSEVHDFGSAVYEATISWDDFRPMAGSSTRFQVRSAETLEQLQLLPFVGPTGTMYSWYSEPGSTLHGMHQGDRYFQYQVALFCSDVMRPPFVRSITLSGDTVDPQGIAGEDSPGPLDPRSARPPLMLGRPCPNPAQSAVELAIAPDEALSSGPLAFAIRVLDLQGRSLRRVEMTAPAGQPVSWQWDLRGDDGRPVPGGVYLARAESAGGGVCSNTIHVIVVR